MSHHYATLYKKLPEAYLVDILEIQQLPHKDTLGMAVRIYLTLNWSKWSDSTRRLYLRSARVLGDAGLWTEHIPTASWFQMGQAVQSAATSKGIMCQTMIFARAVTAFSVRMGHSSRDPLAAHRFSMPDPKGWDEWTVEELAKVPTTYGIGEFIHFAAMTGQRLTDLMNLVRRDIQHSVVEFHQSKTGSKVLLPVTKEMARLPSINRAICTMNNTLPGLASYAPVFDYRNSRQLKYQYYEMTKKLKIDKPFHGLRKLCAIRMAEAGCSMPEIMAVTGHTSTTTAMKYIKGADKYILAKRAMDRVKQMEDEYAVE